MTRSADKRSRWSARALVTLGAIACLAGTPGPPPNQVLKVVPGDPSMFQTINAAVAAARMGDIISISPVGSPYHECVSIINRFNLRVGPSGGARVTIDGTGACPASQAAFAISLSRHVFVQNIDLLGNPGGQGFFVDHSGDVEFTNVSAKGFGGCGLVTSLSVVGFFVTTSSFTNNPGGGLCLNGNGFWITNTRTDGNGNAGILFQGDSGGNAINAWIGGLLSGPSQAVGVVPQAPGRLNNVFVTRSTFGKRGMTPMNGAVGITGTGVNLDVSSSYFYGMGIDTGASGNLTRNVVSNCSGPAFVTGPAPLAMTFASNTAQNCSGAGFDLTGAFASRNLAAGNSGGGFVARDNSFLERNTARTNGGPGFSRIGTQNGGRLNVSDDVVPADFQ
ncbi:MAG: hypothetical protein A2Y95_09920 [Deltaproteobacteria bacterium RBG_13_65_10]|nr:MAG: hypothetical protein A2Y95_09920 [Deltaproteobacteria bacterium RBG_13_65_10]